MRKSSESPRKVLSFQDAQRKRADAKPDIPVASDSIDYRAFDNPETVSRNALFTRAGEILDLLKVWSRPPSSSVALERHKQQQNLTVVSDYILRFKHQELLDEPNLVNRYWAALDILLNPLDDLAKSVRDQYTAELDLMTRFGPKQIEPEINFKESLNKLEEQTTKMLTPRLISLLDGYIRNEFGPSASYLLALVSEYKKRRELS